MAYGYNEMSFLYDKSLNTPVGYAGLENYDNMDSIFGGSYKEHDTESTSGKTSTVIFKHPTVKNTAGIKDYLQNTVERPYKGDSGGSDPNPYSRLLKDFSAKEYRALKIRPGDLVYLRNMGVYPINRMWILRRYADGLVVPNNLNKWATQGAPQPKATVVGWIKPEDGANDKIFNFSFNEGWTTQTKMIHEVFLDILTNEFGGLIGTGAKLLMPSANWSQGLLFGFLNEMHITSYDSNHIPIGDPNVLLEAPIREGGGAGEMWKYTLKSDIQFDLETEYEQKLIGSVDPGSAMLDILQNLVTMGTSEVKYILTAGNSLVQSLLAANQQGGKGALNAWMNFILQFVKAITTAIGTLVTTMVGQLTGGGFKEESTGGSATSNSGTSLAKMRDAAEGIATIISGLFESIINSTVAKYKWPLQGAIALMTGLNTTPWHLTIGNPYSPILSMANVIVDTVNVEGSGDLAYNDIPKRIKVNIKCHVGRNLGGQEIMSMFNNSYSRTYTSAMPPKKEANTEAATNVAVTTTRVTATNTDEYQYVREEQVITNFGAQLPVYLIMVYKYSSPGQAGGTYTLVYTSNPAPNLTLDQLIEEAKVVLGVDKITEKPT